MTDRVLSAFVAFGLAVLVWLYARSRDRETLDNAPVPVEVAVAPGQADRYELEINGPSHVPVSFQGPPSCIRALRGVLQRGELRVTATVVVPEERQVDARYRDTVRIDATDVHAPPGVTAMVLEGRNRIPVTLYRLVERRLPVRLDPAPDERVGQVAMEPARVRVRGPQEVLDRLRAVPTQPVLPQAVGENECGGESQVVEAVGLAQEIDGRAIRCTPATVTVRLTVRPRQKLYDLPSVPVRFLCPPDFRLLPRFEEESAGAVAIKVWGPIADGTPNVVAFIDLTSHRREPGLYGDEPLRVQLPGDYQLAQPAPRSGEFRLVPVSETPAPAR
jgi:hypothetical protein